MAEMRSKKARDDKQSNGICRSCSEPCVKDRLRCAFHLAVDREHKKRVVGTKHAVEPPMKSYPEWDRTLKGDAT